MSLTTLPPELFSCVVSSIVSQPSLSHLAQCSRQFYLWTTPHLYRHVTIIQERYMGDLILDMRLQKLASLLNRRPDLAGFVRSFTLHLSFQVSRDPEYSEEVEEFEESEESEEFGGAEEFEGPEAFREPEEFEEPAESVETKESGEHVSPKVFKVDQTFTTAINAMGFSKEEENELLRDLTENPGYNMDLFLSLLLPALLKLEQLTLDLDVHFSAVYLERMLQRAAHRERPFDIRPPFEALRVVVRSNKVCEEQPANFIASLLKLPAIQVICVDVADVRNDHLDEDKDLMELESSSSPLTSLDLAPYTLHRANLYHILRAPKALKSFSYKICRPACINFIDMCDALGPQENHLEKLAFDYDAEYETLRISFGERWFFEPMTSFIRFNTLKVFKTAALFLTTTDNSTERCSLINIFPPSLETLHLNHFQACFGSVLEAIEQLLARKSPQQIPSLKKIILEEPKWIEASHVRLMDVLWRGTQENAIERLSSVAGAHGVSLDIVKRCRTYSP